MLGLHGSRFGANGKGYMHRFRTTALGYMHRALKTR